MSKFITTSVVVGVLSALGWLGYKRFYNRDLPKNDTDDEDVVEFEPLKDDTTTPPEIQQKDDKKSGSKSKEDDDKYKALMEIYL